MAPSEAVVSAASRGDDGGVLVVGGDRDPNLPALTAALDRRGRAHRLLQVGSDHHPTIAWHLASDRLEIDGREVRPSAVFLRHDVFTHLADRRTASAHRALAWSTTVTAWVDAHPEVRRPNRGAGWRGAPAKPYQLRLAAECGLEVPPTLVANHVGAIDAFSFGRNRIVKPVAGGDYARPLDEALAASDSRGAALPAPAIVQLALVPPERRVFAIGGCLHGFTVISSALDYRTDAATRVEPWPQIPAGLAAGLARLMGALGLDFAAADFKSDPESGRPLFLEINNGPMFAAFDRAAGGAVTDSLADLLVGEG